MHTHNLASVGGAIFEGLLSFLPDWLAFTIIGLILVAVVANWVIKLVRKIQYRRAVRSGRPIHAAAQYGQRPGSHYLGSYAPPAGQPVGGRQSPGAAGAPEGEGPRPAN